jgi:hypothetical protein
MSSRTRRCALWLMLASALVAPSAMANVKPAVVQAEFKRWTAELETMLQGQPKNGELRQNLRLWFTDQTRSLSKVKEPILSASLPSKMWGSAAWVTDSANKDFGSLKAQEYRALLDFSNRILDYCFKAYSPKQTVCTDDHYWELKAKNSIYLAQLAEPDSKALLARVPELLKASFKPLSGTFFSYDAVDTASDRCMGWFRLTANFLMPEFNNEPARLSEPVYVEAYMAQAAETLRICEQAKANPNVFTRHIADLGIAAVNAAKPVSAEAMRLATPIAERAFAILLADRDDQGSTTGRTDHQLKLFLLAHALGKREQAKLWAESIPESLRDVSQRTGDDFNCRFFVSETQRTPNAWREAVAVYPEAYRAMSEACPQLSQ